MPEVFLKGNLGKGGSDYAAGAAVYVEPDMEAGQSREVQDLLKKQENGRKEGLSHGTAEVRGEYLVVRNAKKAVLLLAGTSTFYEENPQQKIEELFTKAREKGYGKLKEDHIADYRKLFGANQLKLWPEDGKNADAEEGEICLTTAERLKRIRQGASDPELITAYYDFGRYLLISSSRPGSLPANLQGIWNHRMQPPWESKYTININTQMNYWPALECSLAGQSVCKAWQRRTCI